MSKKLIAFNWKMYPKKLKEVERLVLAFDGIDIDLKKYEIAIAPPTVYLSMISEVFCALKAEIRLVLQNCSWEQEGAFTGEISAEMGKQFGVEYVIIGHSERRQHFGETDAMINKKVEAALQAGLKVILCVGESADIRKKGTVAVKKHIKTQLEKNLQSISNLKFQIKNSISIAYEPIWAIGTGKAATAEDAFEVIGFIKKILSEKYKLDGVRVLYGGSVNTKNVLEFVGQEGIDGALIGGASVDKKELKGILKMLK